MRSDVLDQDRLQNNQLEGTADTVMVTNTSICNVFGRSKKHPDHKRIALRE